MSELIRREDAIKATWQEPSYTDPYNILTEVRDRIKALPTVSPWHRVEEELPKHGQRILICLRFTNLDGEEEPAKTVYGYFENFEKKGRRYWTWEDEEALMEACMSKESDFDPEYGTTRITHWMPLPEPPKEENNG
jgi:hypothetical protein